MSKNQILLISNFMAIFLLFMHPLLAQSQETTKQVDEEEVFMVVETMPEPKGGLQEFYKYIGQNLKYPAEARQVDAAGRVIISFIINQEGQIENPTLIKGVHPLLDAEALRVLKEYPHTWTPGKQRGRAVNVKMAIPVMFGMTQTAQDHQPPDKEDKNPLFVIDGKIMEKRDQTVLIQVNPQDIASIEVLKGAKATAIYGTRGANGVVIIKLKESEILREEAVEMPIEEPTVPEEESITTSEVVIYPNPTQEVAKVRLDLDQSQSVQINVINLADQSVTPLIDRVLGEGSHEFDWNTLDVEPNLYLIEVIQDGKSTFHRVLIDR